jgi:hypothetical protein
MPTQNQIEVKKYITPDIKKQMTGWEKQFITSIYNSKKEWSFKQVKTFEGILKKYNLNERKVVEKVIYLPLAYAKGASVNQKITSKLSRRNRGINNSKNGFKLK